MLKTSNLIPNHTHIHSLTSQNRDWQKAILYTKPCRHMLADSVRSLIDPLDQFWSLVYGQFSCLWSFETLFCIKNISNQSIKFIQKWRLWVNQGGDCVELANKWLNNWLARKTRKKKRYARHSGNWTKSNERKMGWQQRQQRVKEDTPTEGHSLIY